MHAANENDIGPGKVRKPGVLDVLINETGPPALRQIGSDDQQTLWRHERAYTGHERKRVRESAERRRVGRKDTKYVAAMLDGNRAVQAPLLAPASAQRSPMTAECLHARPFRERPRSAAAYDRPSDTPAN